MVCVVNATPPAALSPGKTRYYCIVGWVGPRAGLYECGKSRLSPGFDAPTVQSYRVAIPTELSRPTIFRLYSTVINMRYGMFGKGKAMPLQSLTGPEGF
jgi:hypothetical protein